MVAFTYENDLLTRVTSRTGLTFDLAYDGRGKLLSVRDSAARTTRFLIDAVGDLIQVTDAVGGTRRFVYDSDHRLIAQYGSRNERSEYVYRNGRVVTARNYDTDGSTLLRERTFSPSALNGEVGDALRRGQGTEANPIPIVLDRVDRYVDGRGIGNTRETNARGQTIMAEDGLARVVRYAFSSRRELLSFTRANGSLTEYQYDNHGNVIQVQELSAPGTVYSTTTVDRGPFDLVSRVIDAEAKQTTLAYDALGNPTTITDHDGNRTMMSYGDSRFPSLATSFVLPTGDTVTATYDAHGNLATLTDYPDPVAQPAGRTTTFGYDAAGNLTASTDPRSERTQYTYDALGRVQTVTDARLQVDRLDYEDPACGCQTPNLTGITFANGTTIRWKHDGLNRIVVRTDQLGKQTRYEWDPEDNLKTWRNRNGEAVTYEYDRGGQLTRKLVDGAGTTVYRYDVEGNAIGADCVDADLELEYDFLSRLTVAVTRIRCHTLETGRTPSIEHRVDYTYDRVGNRTTLLDSFGLMSQTYAYDNLHRLATLTLPAEGNQRWTFGYDASGRRTSLAPSPGGRQTTYDYDRAGQTTAIEHASNPPISLQYPMYDGAGNRLTQIRQTGSQRVDQSFRYDAVSELVWATFYQVFGDVRVDRTYSYDAANRLQADEDYSYTYDDEGRLVRRVRSGSSLAEEYAHDAEGRLRRYAQSVEVGGVPQAVATAAYGYDAYGRRAFRSVNQVSRAFVYDGDNLLHEVDVIRGVERSYAHGLEVDDQLLLREAVSGALYFYCHDALNSVVALTDAGGSRVQQYEYEEYGNVIARHSATFSQPFGFTGGECNLESGSLHLRAREYEPGTGRFAVEDPLDVAGGSNLYGYVGNRPSRYTDPYGLTPKPDAWTKGWGTGPSKPPPPVIRLPPRPPAPPPGGVIRGVGPWALAAVAAWLIVDRCTKGWDSPYHGTTYPEGMEPPKPPTIEQPPLDPEKRKNNWQR